MAEECEADPAKSTASSSAVRNGSAAASTRTMDMLVSPVVRRNAARQRAALHH